MQPLVVWCNIFIRFVIILSELHHEILCPGLYLPSSLFSALIPSNEALLLGPYKNLQAIKLIFIPEIIFQIAI